MKFHLHLANQEKICHTCHAKPNFSTMANVKRNLFVTENGLKTLGNLIRTYRQNLLVEMRLEDLRDKIIQETGYAECSISTLSKLEVGHMKFNSDLVAAIATAMPIPHPFEDRAYTDWELQEIARENIDPKMGISSAYVAWLKNILTK